jgi:hypothetical protein
MAIFKAPRITTSQRENITLQVSEIVYDLDQAAFYGGDGINQGGFLIGENSGFNVETITLTEEHIREKRIILEKAPLVPECVTLLPEGGIVQANGVDFRVVGRVLSWQGLGLDNFLEKDEVLIIQY